MQEEPPVLFKQIPAKRGQIGLITLNRPQALNALSSTMILLLYDQLKKWAIDPAISLVIIHSVTERSFCAGGDLKEVYHYGTTRNHIGMEYYAEEYKLDLFIYNYPKPYIALLNGFAMGGGLGISLHGTRIIAAEKLLLAMPETGIGFYPDVGAGYFFQRCPHKIGMYLGLTGNLIGIADACYAKLVDAFVPGSSFTRLISELSLQDLSSDPLDVFDGVLDDFIREPSASTLEEHAPIIEACFSKNSVEEIIAALSVYHSAWAKQQAHILNTKSPTSLKVTYKLLSLEAKMDLKDCLDMEFNLARKMFQKPDIYEGIRAALIDKTHDPKWQPPTLQEVNDADIDKLFNN